MAHFCIAVLNLDAIARKVMNVRYQLVATPAWIAEQITLHHPRDLSGLGGIGWWDGGQMTRFRLFSEQGEIEEFSVHPRLTTNNLVIAQQAALAGLGMTRLPENLCEQYLRDGSLSPVLTGWRPFDVSIFALYKTRRSLILAGRIYLEELTAALNQWAPE